MEKICYCCNRYYLIRTRAAHFYYGELRFHIPENEIGCNDCVAKEYISDFESYGRKFIKRKSKRFIIDWKEYLSFQCSRNELDRATRLLISIKRLFIHPTGKWAIISGRSLVNPVYSGVNTFFVHKEDAVLFAKQKPGIASSYLIFRISYDDVQFGLSF